MQRRDSVRLAEARGYIFWYAGVEGTCWCGVGECGYAVGEREAPHDAEGLRGSLTSTDCVLLRSRDRRREYPQPHRLLYRKYLLLFLYLLSHTHKMVR